MFLFLIKSVPKHRRLQAVVLLLIVCFVVSLFMVDLDVEENGELEDSAMFSSGGSATANTKTAPRESTGEMGEEAGNSPNSLAQFSLGSKLVTGYKYKVFVYDDEVPTELHGSLKRDLHCQGEYNGMEGLFPDFLKKLDVYTPYGDVADYYVVPVMTECFINKKLTAGKDFNRAVNDLNALFEKTLDKIQSSYPYWSRTEGRDHIFIFPSERGPVLLNEGNMLRIKKSIFLTGLTTYKPSVFEPWKDVVIPAWRKADNDMMFQPKPSYESERETFVHFRGSVPGLEDKQPSGLTYEIQKAVVNSTMKGKILFSELDDKCSNVKCVEEEMRKSTFCLCPGGDYEGWSLRLYHAISAGCIPVILADKAELPYVQLLDYSTFSIKILERDAGTIPKVLNEIKEEKIREKQKALQGVVDRFSWRYFTSDSDGKTSWKPNTALDSLLQILNLKLRYMRNSPYHFWLKEEV